MDATRGRLAPWLIGAAIVLLPGLGGVALLDPDEPRYAAAAREMLRTGDPVVPVFNGAPRLNKPPLIYWLQAGSIAALGESETAARIPSAAAALATLAAVGWFARRRLSPGAGPTAIAVLATTPIFFAVAHLAITDALLTLCCTLTLLGWREAVEAPPGGTRRAAARLSGLACGLAVLTKGPVGVLLPAAVILMSEGVDRMAGRKRTPDRPGGITWRGLAIGISGVALVTGPWLAGLAGRIGPGAVVDLVARESIARAGPGLDHPRPFWYFLATFWPLFLPWSLLLPVAAARALRSGDPPGAGIEAAARRRTDRFLLIWTGGVLIFFSALADKNDAWILPAAPPLALLVASRCSARGVRVGAGIAAAALAVAVILGGGALSETRSLRGVVRAAGLDRDAPFDLIAYRIEKPSLVWYARRDAVWLRSAEDLDRALAARPPDRPVAIVMTHARWRSMTAPRRALLDGFDPIAGQDGYIVLFRGR